MSLLDQLFNRNPSAPQQSSQQQQTQHQQGQQQQSGQQGQQQQQQQQQQGNPPVPDPQNSNTPNDPAVGYANLWDNTNTPADTPPRFNIPSEKLTEAAGKLNFLQGIPSDVMEQVQQGNGDAMVKALGLMGQNMYSTILGHSTALTDSFVTSRAEYDQKKLGSNVQGTLTETFLAQNPAFKNPAARKHLKEVATQMRTKFPDASANEIAEASVKYLQEIAGLLSPETSTKKEEGTEEDWDQIFGGN